MPIGGNDMLIAAAQAQAFILILVLILVTANKREFSSVNELASIEPRFQIGFWGSLDALTVNDGCRRV